MVAYTTTYNLKKPTVADDEDVWGGYLNDSMDLIDDVLDGTTPVTGIDINSGTIDNVVVGGTTAVAGTFTVLTADTSLGVTGNITVSGTVDGRDVAADGTKLDGIESGATADQTKADIDALGIAASTASTLATARNIAVTGAVTGNANFDGSGNISISTTATSDPTVTLTGAVTGSGTMTNLGNVSIATTATADPTLTLNGDASGSATFTNLGSATLTVTVADDSHNHVISNVDGLQTALDGKQAAGTYNTVIGTDTDLDTSGSTIIDNIFVTDGVITSMGTRTLTPGDIGALSTSGKAADSNLLDGLDLHTGTNNQANKVVRTNSSGYADFGWINTISGNTTSTLSDIYVNTNDGYIRKSTLAHVASQGGYHVNSYSNNMTANQALADDWFRSIGATGWYNNTYAGGIYMTDSTWVRVYGGKQFLVDNKAKADSWQEVYTALSGTTPTIDADTAGAFSLTMTGNTTFTFSAVDSSVSVGFVLQLTGNGSTVTWPSSVDWAGGTAPDAPASGETDILVFWTRDGGTTWYGVQSIDAAA